MLSPAALSRKMGHMNPKVPRGTRHILQAGLLFLLVAMNIFPAFGQVSYSVPVAMEKPKYLLGEPIFCRFVIRNTGSNVFAFRYRTPTRGLAADYDQEPRFQVTDRGGGGCPIPALGRAAARRGRPFTAPSPCRRGKFIPSAGC